MVPWVRGLVGVIILAGLAWWVDAGDVLARLSGLSPGWVLAALALGVIQTVLSAWRWRYTAHRLGLDLRLRRALQEYYLAVFLNQVLPGGVVGDAARAWRHAGPTHGRTPVDRGTALRAVLIERASGQVVMGVVAVASLLVLGGTQGDARFHAAGLALACALAGAGAWSAGLWGRSRAPSGVLARFQADARRALLSGSAPWVQGATSTAIVLSYVATYLLAARAIGVDLPLPVLAPLVAPVLLAMLIPLSVAGWGMREGAAAALWGVVGLAPAEGVAISVAYGLLVLVGTLPGAWAFAAAGAVQARDVAGWRSRSNRTSSPSG